MKNRFVLSLLLAVTLVSVDQVAQADIQSPPGHHYNWSRKLSRGFGNVALCITEPFNVWMRTNRSDGANAAAMDFMFEGVKRIFVRAGYGAYEFVTFPVPSYKLTYRPPYYRKEKMDPWWGYTEFSPQIGAISEAEYSRTQGW